MNWQRKFSSPKFFFTFCQFLSRDELNKIRIIKWDSNDKLISVTDSMIDAVELSSSKNSNIPGVQETCKSKDAFVVLNSTSNQPPTCEI